MRNNPAKDTSELEAVEQREWRESLDYVIQQGDRGRVQRLLAALRHQARMPACRCRSPPITAYINTIRADEQTPLPRQPGNRAPDQEPRPLERHGDGRARQPRADGIGGHISTYASAATLYEVGFNHFFQRPRQRRRRRHHLLPGPRLARHLRARVPRRPALGRAARQLPPRADAGRRPVVLPASRG